MNQKIYLDNSATTKIDAEVLEVIKNEIYPANPSSMHFYGRRAKNKLEKSREEIASFLNVDANSLFFTSGGTEANNLALNSLFNQISKEEENPHILASEIDHPSVYNLLTHNLKNKKFDITFLKVKSYGALHPEQIQNALTNKTKLIVVSAVNAETGVKTNIDAIAKIAKQNNIYLFVDGVALLGKELFTIDPGISAMTFSSHKIHGPTGVGLCYFKNQSKLLPLFFGGAQEAEKRAGSENITGILGFAKAIELLKKHLPEKTSQMLKLRTYFERFLTESIKDTFINGNAPRVCNTVNICFKGIDAETLLILLDKEGIFASHGSACSAGAMSASRILLNMGLDPKDARSSVRFSMSRYTTKKELNKALKTILILVNKLKN